MRWLCVLFAVAACGEHNTHTGIDALVPDTGPPADALPPGCDYGEQHDATNDDVPPSPGAPEPTGLTIGAKTTICGKFQSTHFDGQITVDVDGYTATIGADTDVLVRLSGAGAEAIELVGVDVYGGAAFDQLQAAVTFYGDHGVSGVHLAAGTYEFVPFALNSSAIAADVAYKLVLATDSLETRCPVLTTGGYPEAHDGTNNTDNDMIAFPTSAPTMLTAALTDIPEPSGITTSATSNNRITGSAANVTTADRYEDKDTFAFTTGAANELTVRLGWTGAANLDFYVFEVANPDPIATANTATANAELDMFSLKPNTNYWLLVGAAAGGSGLPAPYSATLCGNNYP